MEGSLSIELAGERLLLLPERALYWPAQQTLFVADVHLGKAAAFRAAGIPAPEAVTGATLQRLTRLLEQTRAARLIVLGDLVHAASGLTDTVCHAVAHWRQTLRGIEMVLVTGNHDRRAGGVPANWQVADAGERFELPPFALLHHPGAVAGRYALAGHLHPGIRLRGLGGERLKLPCFWLGEGQGVLPAFGDFTGLSLISPQEGDRVYAVAEDAVCPIPVSETSSGSRG
jgi:DNA ligase-associated metallophosphoesterase